MDTRLPKNAFDLLIEKTSEANANLRSLPELINPALDVLWNNGNAGLTLDTAEALISYLQDQELYYGRALSALRFVNENVGMTRTLESEILEFRSECKNNLARTSSLISQIQVWLALELKDI